MGWVRPTRYGVCEHPMSSMCPLAFFTLLCLVLVLLLHLLPCTTTGIPTAKRINTVLLLLVINAAVRCAVAAHALSIPFVETLYTTTVLSATLVPVALYHQAGCLGRKWSPFECVARTAPVHVYGMVPVLWVLIRSDQLNKLNMRLVTLLVSLGLTDVFSLNNCRLRKKSRALRHNSAPSNSVLVNLLGLSLLWVIYLAIEVTIGWLSNWWPRAFEPLFCLLILFQGEFLSYARALAGGICVRQPLENALWRIEALSGESKDHDDQAWATWVENHQPHGRRLTPIPADSESCASRPHKTNVPVIAMQGVTLPPPTPEADSQLPPTQWRGTL
ncbi:hypothetical protein CspeluHIS016_0309570 [Cutaneotrichosporon spelunceum]|uniref:Uncharacterized protein n=1 Tax=Cutaneotrichosporon spelunceum TaxID=1672016 RepID=A0AAD3TV89_9TREE|nr:hypothetical protein CspeluHIS016_0309570 [Cutaneotrichosporon spelunceum]